MSDEPIKYVPLPKREFSSRPIRDAIIEVMEMDASQFATLCKRKNLTGYQKLAMKLRKAIEKDSLAAISLVSERVEGKPDQAVHVTQDGGSPVEVLSQLFAIAASRQALPGTPDRKLLGVSKGSIETQSQRDEEE